MPSASWEAEQRKEEQSMVVWFVFGVPVDYIGSDVESAMLVHATWGIIAKKAFP